MTKPTPHGQVPEALRLAEALERPGYGWHTTPAQCAAVLRRLHAENEALRTQQPAPDDAPPGAYVNGAGIKADDRPSTVIRKLNARFHDLVTFPRAEKFAAAPTPPSEQQATKETSGGVTGWRDISTAPKDGSRFVATGHNYGLYSEVRHTCVAQWFQGCWMEASDWNETSELRYLTHWMPLPSPPDDVAAPAEQAAPKAAPAPLSEMPYEKRKAVQEGEQIGASDAWFHARHNMLDTLDRRNVFRAGFDRGWNAALAAQRDTP